MACPNIYGPYEQFWLVGDRNYVQGTQMLARAAASIDATVTTLAQCTFRRISGLTPIITAISIEQIVSAAALGEATFISNAGIHRFMFAELDIVPPRMPEHVAWTLTRTGGAKALTERFTFTAADDLEALLGIVIRGLKLLHQEFGHDVSDVWFTSCRRSTLATPPSSDGEMHVAPLRTLNHGVVHQTLSKVQIVFRNGVCQNAIVGFAFRSKRLVRAD